MADDGGAGNAVINDVNCTLLTSDNLDAAYHIHCEAQPKPWSKATFSDCLTSPYYALSLADSKGVSGYAIVLEVADEATLMDIAVSTSSRGQGRGQRLLNDVIHHARAHQMQSLWLEVRAGNAAAIRLYEKNGFSHIETRKGYYPAAHGREDAYIMCLSLTT